MHLIHHPFSLFDTQHSVFLNTMVTGTPKNQTEALGGLKPWNFIVDIPAGTADIPGDGKTPVPFTSTQDVGRFVAGSLDLERWEPVSGMAGDKKTYDEVVEIVERITGGKRKMLRRYTSVEELRRKAREGTNMFVRSMCQVSTCSRCLSFQVVARTEWSRPFYVVQRPVGGRGN